MENNITELVFILDQSGSMAGLTDDTIGGFNSMLAKQKDTPGECYVTTVLFNDDAVTIHDRLPLAEVPDMTKKDYCPQSCTALLDAVGDTIRHIADIHRYVRAEDVPGKTLFIITTDGMENASHRYSADAIRQMIRQKREESGWEFLFLGANIDAVETAERYGIDRKRAVTYKADRAGTEEMYACMEKAAVAYRVDSRISDDWVTDITGD